MRKLLKKVALAVLCLLPLSSVMALPRVTEPVFARGDKTMSLLLGYGDGFTQKLAFDFSAIDGWFAGRGSMGIGASVGNCIGKHWNRLSLELTASLHYQLVDKLDTYVSAGAGGGYKWYDHLYGSDKGFFSWSTNAGVRWYFSSSWALNVEAGYTMGSYILAGVTWRF